MKITPVRPEDLRGVFAVPPLARRADSRRAIDTAQNDRILRHMAAGGIRRFLYGGNAFLYHATLAEYEEMLGWLAGMPEDHWAIPSVGPSFGRAMDQAPLLRRHRFPAAMALPCSDPRDAAGLEAGLREFADAASLGVILYLKEEGSFGSDRTAGLDAVARLVESKVCVGIKYAVMRPDAVDDPYLKQLLERVDRSVVVSGMGERPAVAHLKAFDLPGFTTGSGCVAPSLCQSRSSRRRRPRTGPAPRISGARSCPSRTSATRGDPLASSMPPPSWPASPTTGSIPPFVSATLRPAAGRAGAHRAYAGGARARARRRRRAQGRERAPLKAPPRKEPADLRSARWFGRADLRTFAHRSRTKQMGFAASEFDGRPVIAILNTWSDINPCHTHFRPRAEEVKRGVWQAGGFPLEMPVALASARRS